MKCAIYARVSKKAKSPCPHCHKLVRLVDDCLIKHVTREDLPCAGSGEHITDTADKGQDTENQLIQLREYCKRQNWEIVTEYIDRETAKHGLRDSFKQLFDDASKRHFDVVLVWALDRFTREGVLETFEYIRDLTRYGVQFESYSEAHFRTTGPTGELMLAVAAWIAKQERVRISDRTKAGVARAKSQGKHCGRPFKVFQRDKAIVLRKQGLSWRSIGQKLNVNFGTVRRSVLGVPKASA
jgi:DNA invertase Pin-like site-specific DNA recombinase